MLNAAEEGRDLLVEAEIGGVAWLEILSNLQLTSHLLWEHTQLEEHLSQIPRNGSD